MTAAGERVLLTRREAAAYLGYALRTFERNVQESIAWVRCGRALRTTRGELDRWVNERLERDRARIELGRAERSSTQRRPPPSRRPTTRQDTTISANAAKNAEWLRARLARSKKCP